MKKILSLFVSLALLVTQAQATYIPNASEGANGATAPTSSTQIGIKDGTGKLQPASSTNPVPVTTTSSTLPTNAAQETGGNLATLATGVSGSKYQCNITNASIPVTGTFFQATQPVSGTVAVSNFPATQPVSGTVTANAGTNLNTSALALESGGNLATLAGAITSAKVQTNIAQVAGSTIATAATGIMKVGLTDGTGNALTSSSGALNINSPDSAASGTVSALNGAVTLSTPGGDATWTISITGTWVGTLTFTASDASGVNWAVPVTHFDVGNINVAPSSTTTINGLFKGMTSGVSTVAVTMGTYTSGTATIFMHISSGAGPVFLLQPLPPGTNIMGKVGIDQTTVGTTNGVSIAQVGTTTVVTGGVNGSLGVGGLAANNASLAGNPVTVSGSAINATPTAATNGQNAIPNLDLEHYILAREWANKENIVKGCANTASATNTSLIAAQGAGIKIYMLGYSIYNSGVANSLTSFTSASGGTLMWTAPSVAGGGALQILPLPIATAANAALFVTTATASTTQYICAIGYIGG